MTDLEPLPLNVLVTGAAGRLGSAVSALLHENGHHVLATDIASPGEVPYRFEQVDLLDHEAVGALLDGRDVVLHIANHPGIGSRPPQVVFNENVSMNANVFQGAAEQGVSRLVFASTLQLIGSHVDSRTVVDEPTPPSYPLHGGTRPAPSNLYALSKTVSEVMLEYYAERCGMDVVALRLPLLHNHEEWVGISRGEETSSQILEGFSGLTHADAARLFLSVLDADLRGYRVYMAGTSHRHRDLSLPELLTKHYPDLPAGIADLVDMSAVIADSGWTPSQDYWPPRTTPDATAPKEQHS